MSDPNFASSFAAADLQLRAFRVQFGFVQAEGTWSALTWSGVTATQLTELTRRHDLLANELLSPRVNGAILKAGAQWARLERDYNIVLNGPGV